MGSREWGFCSSSNRVTNINSFNSAISVRHLRLEPHATLTNNNPTPYSLLPTPHSLLPTPYSLLPIFSHAAFAASCSALFLLRPVPAP
jgi:hypothetical protein